MGHVPEDMFGTIVWARVVAVIHLFATWPASEGGSHAPATTEGLEPPAGLAADAGGVLDGTRAGCGCIKTR